MLYINFITKAKELTIGYDDASMFYYLEPEWQSILYENQMGIESISDMNIEGWYELEDVLKLEVEKRNAKTSKLNIILNWIGDIITTSIDPSVVDSENDLARQVIEAAVNKYQQNESKE